mgnify:CR=1 FL=1
MENLVNFFINAFSGLDKNVVVFLISMFPLLELRGGMIAAAVFKMPYLQAMKKFIYIWIYAIYTFIYYKDFWRSQKNKTFQTYGSKNRK